MSEPSRPLVIYHAACRDGFAAAWAARRAMPDAEVFEGFYGQEPPDVCGRDVYLLDFTYPMTKLMGVIGTARSTTILDHHKTARADLHGVNENLAHIGIGPAKQIVFDMERSGAGIAWDVLISGDDHGGDRCSCGNKRDQSCPYARPWAIDYVEDRDLWRWALPNSRAVNAFLGAVPFEFSAWDALLSMPLGDAVKAGEAIQMKVRQYAAEVGKNALRVNILGHKDVPIVNAPQCDVSELLESLMDVTGKTFVMAWWQRADRVFQYSLRSRGDLDVSALAKQHGGGGHKNAAGFQVPTLAHA